MGLAEFKVTNITSGRLELKAYRCVLGLGESKTLAAPLAEEINWFLGMRLLKIEALESAKAIKAQPFTLAEPVRLAGDKKGRRDKDQDSSPAGG